MNQNVTVALNKQLLRLGILLGTGVVLLFIFGGLAKQSDVARQNFYEL